MQISQFTRLPASTFLIIFAGTPPAGQLHTVNGAETKFIRFQQLHQPFAPLCGVVPYVPPVAVLLRVKLADRHFLSNRFEKSLDMPVSIIADS